MWWGMAAGQWLQRRHSDWLSVKLPRSAGWLSLMGRWSLSYYLLHQPILLGILSALIWVMKT